jgi:hypothetical protein
MLRSKNMYASRLHILSVARFRLLAFAFCVERRLGLVSVSARSLKGAMEHLSRQCRKMAILNFPVSERDIPFRNTANPAQLAIHAQIGN